MDNKTPGPTPEDKALIEQSLAGNRKALESLIGRHQHWIFNIALNFVSDRDEAADITQEALLRIVTKLSTFRHESDFRTWMYRIVKNHFLNMKRGRYETCTLTFEQFGQSLDNTRDESLAGRAFEAEQKLLVEEAKLSCMKGMLLCLDREQRMIYIIGELFEFPDSVGSEVMEISRENFRTKLHRAKQQLYNFMDNKCGLINQKNPCRCARKTAGFIKMGFVDPVNRHFQRDAVARIDEVVAEKVETYTGEILAGYRQLYQAHPFLKSPEGLASIQQLLSSEAVKKTFNFS